MKYFCLIMTILLSGCAAAPCVPKVETQIVKVEVQVPCKVDVPSKPKYNKDALVASDSMYDKVRALLADRELDLAYTGQLEAALTKCTSAK